VTIEHGADAMRAFGARLARAVLAAPASQSLLVTLSGDLGAGKTTLVGGLLAELGHVGPVRSPTYTLIEPYRLQGRDIAHCDLYRLRHPDELDDLGLRDLQGTGSVLLVEWPERRKAAWARPTWRWHSITPGRRRANWRSRRARRRVTQCSRGSDGT
jgi:tRNA threonylcarbamoyladenosine biosynthesis protein TsaE